MVSIHLFWQRIMKKLQKSKVEDEFLISTILAEYTHNEENEVDWPEGVVDCSRTFHSHSLSSPNRLQGLLRKNSNSPKWWKRAGFNSTAFSLTPTEDLEYKLQSWRIVNGTLKRRKVLAENNEITYIFQGETRH